MDEEERKRRTQHLVETYYGSNSLKLSDGKKDWAYNAAPGLQRAEMLAWELRLPNHQDHEPGGGPLKVKANGMIAPNKKAQNPAMPFFDFDCASDPRHPEAKKKKYGIFNKIAETRYHFAFVPAGKEGVNTILYSKGGSSSLQSLMHVLVIPKRCYKQRVFNAVTIPEDYPFEDAMKCGRDAIEILHSKNVPGSLTYWENKYEHTTDDYGNKIDVTDDDGNKIDLELADSRQYPPSVMKKMDIKNILDTLDYTVHVSPNNSIQSLHIHVFSTVCLTKAYQIAEKSHWDDGTVKNVPIEYFMPNGCCRQMVNKNLKKVRDSPEFQQILNDNYNGKPLYVGAAGTRALNGLTFVKGIVGMQGWSLSDYDTKNLSNPGHNNMIREKENKSDIEMSMMENESRLNEKIVNSDMISFQQGSFINGRLLTRATGIKLNDNGRIVENMYPDKEASRKEIDERKKLCNDLVKACLNREEVAEILTDKRYGLHNTRYKGTFAHDVKLLFTLNKLPKLVQQGIVVVKELYYVKCGKFDERLTLESCLDKAKHWRFEHVIAENKRLEWNKQFNEWLSNGEKVSVQGVATDPGPDNMRDICQDIDDAMMLKCLENLQRSQIIISDDCQIKEGSKFTGIRTNYVSENLDIHKVTKTFFNSFYREF